ncbi:X box binding protein 1 [Brevipalpus obovatus]|uniref:X box binding protein 1 n=1 Tax=Brevipalpus obovatus TaxID=246614 RepID=UPI003D9F3CEA
MRLDSSLFILRDSPQNRSQNMDQKHRAAMKRKREKLDHLSEDEKLLRRKIKNRISAQTARDRKKAKLGELEALVDRLNRDNEEKAERIKQLEAENASLRTRTTSPLEEKKVPSIFGEQSSDSSFESAAFINGSLPKNQELSLVSSPLWTRILISLLMVVTAATKSSNGCTSAPKIFSKQIPSQMADSPFMSISKKNSILMREILIWIKKLKKSRPKANNLHFLLGG